MNAKLNNRGEALWQELRQHLDWNDGFALIFYFASNVELTDIFKHRLQQFFIGHTTRLQEISFQPDDPDWLLNTMRKLLYRDESFQLLNAPVWVALHHTQNEYALSKYRDLLMRLNERRDVWRKAYPAPMIFILPDSLRSELGGLVPDLWSIRVISEWLDNDLLLVDEIREVGSSPYNSATPEVKRFPIPATAQLTLDEWQRLENKGERVTFERVRVARRALDVWLRYGWLDEAEALAECVLALSRQLNEGETPESLNDLSVSLDSVGKVAQQQGRWGHAESAHEESLGIRRRLCELLDDTSESLRDLSVSLDNVGKVAQQQGRWGDAESAHEESLEIRRRLCELLGETPALLRDLSVSLDNVGGVAQQHGCWGDAQNAYGESLRIRRSLVERLGNTPESLRDLSVALEKLGDVLEYRGRWGDAQNAYEESLELSRRLTELLNEAPESLRDLSLSLDRVGDIAQRQNRWDAAQDACEESLGIRRLLTKLLEDTPESLRDLSLSLIRCGDIAQQQGHSGFAKDFYEENLSIHLALIELLGNTPGSLRDLAVSTQRLAMLSEAQGQNDEAVRYFKKSLKLGQRLTVMLPDMQYFTEIETFSRQKIKELTGSETE